MHFVPRAALVSFVTALSFYVHSASADDLTAEARARFAEGVAAYDAGQYEIARAKFLQANALKKHPDVLLNLGWCDLKTGRNDEAAKVFQEYLDTVKDPAPAKKADAERGLTEARKAASDNAKTAEASARASEPGGATARPTETAAGSTTRPTETAAARPAEAGSGAASSDTATSDAGNQAPDPSKPVMVDLSGLLGASSQSLGAGIGARGGAIINGRIFVGGLLVYNFGTSTTTALGDVTSSVWYIGPEGGYDFTVGPVILRPYAGLGLGVLTTRVPGTTVVNGVPSRVNEVSSSDTRVMFWPGGVVLYPIPNTKMTVGADTHLLTLPDGVAFCFFGTVGARL